MANDFDWSGPISWALIIAGWLVVNRQHNTRETRKEVRASLNELYELLNGIEEDAVTYHTGDDDPVLSRRIKRRLGQIYPRVNLAFTTMIDCKCSRDVLNFRQAVTLQNFDTSTHGSLDANDPAFETISTTKEVLINRIEKAFLAHYRK